MDVRFTKQADDDIIDSYIYGFLNFGQEQADRYEQSLRIAATNGLPDRDAAAALAAVIDAIAQGLQGEERVEIRGFGVFDLRAQSARRAHNPRTGEFVQVDSRKMVKFRAGKQLSALLNDDPDALALLRDERAGQLSLF